MSFFARQSALDGTHEHPYLYKKKNLVLIVCSPTRIFAHLHRLIQTLENYKIDFIWNTINQIRDMTPIFLKSNVLLSLNKN